MYAPKGLTLEERLIWTGWSVTETGCWEWSGSKDTKGYGVLTYSGKTVKAHRAAYEVWSGDIPRGFLIRHSCDNPPCINPKHLSPGNAKQNMQDKMIRGRYKCLYGEMHPNSKLTSEEVSCIREEHQKGVLTQRMLAEVFGVSTSTISLLINHKQRRNG